ncbi:hypothetical protein F5Y01DRAFT_198916 [Xylaria sp. FL0043]|nr:hypothetical protein F5Y01DRAFT_198916 [Xylaria sp. FL0043]
MPRRRRLVPRKEHYSTSSVHNSIDNFGPSEGDVDSNDDTGDLERRGTAGEEDTGHIQSTGTNSDPNPAKTSTGSSTSTGIGIYICVRFYIRLYSDTDSDIDRRPVIDVCAGTRFHLYTSIAATTSTSASANCNPFRWELQSSERRSTSSLLNPVSLHGLSASSVWLPSIRCRVSKMALLTRRQSPATAAVAAATLRAVSYARLHSRPVLPYSRRSRCPQGYSKRVHPLVGKCCGSWRRGCTRPVPLG